MMRILGLQIGKKCISVGSCAVRGSSGMCWWFWVAGALGKRREGIGCIFQSWDPACHVCVLWSLTHMWKESVELTSFPAQPSLSSSGCFTFWLFSHWAKTWLLELSTFYKPNKSYLIRPWISNLLISVPAFELTQLATSDTEMSVPFRALLHCRGLGKENSLWFKPLSLRGGLLYQGN